MEYHVVTHGSCWGAIVGEEIRRNGFAFRAAAGMQPILCTPGCGDWSSYASSWEQLGPDLYMADGGRYRRRRFAAFGVDLGSITRKPHQPHYQSRDYNPLNGGLQRWFEPVDETVAAHELTRNTVSVCTRIFGACAAASPDQARWHVEMHQFRIEAAAGRSGRPTPEGRHRDGVDWVCVILVNRRNVSSGVTEISDPDGRSLGQFTLIDPLDTVFIDDARVLHGVTPIRPLDPDQPGFRDVLVLTFRREDPRSNRTLRP